MDTEETVVHVPENSVAVAAVTVEQWKNPGKYAWNACPKNKHEFHWNFSTYRN